MFRISVTTLERFRRFMAATSSYDTEQALVDTLTGKFQGNDKTWFGTAFHAIIEKPELINQQYRLIETVDRGRKVGVPRHIAEVAARHKAAHPLMVCEVAASKIYDTGRGAVKVSGRVDGIEGAHVRDSKTKFRAPGTSEYMDSCQWKFYLDMLEAKAFFYDVFEIRGFEGLGTCDGLMYPLVSGEDMEITVIPHDPIACYAYADMRSDCINLLNEFMDWVSFRNHWKLLKQETPLARQRVIKLNAQAVLTGKQCPYCGDASRLVNSFEIYGASYGLAYWCRPCDAYVGTHQGSNIALGRLANAELRQWKIKAHDAFDKLWKGKSHLRTKAYQWLAQKMDLSVEQTHIGMFDVEQCKRVVEVCPPELIALI